MTEPRDPADVAQKGELGPYDAPVHAERPTPDHLAERALDDLATALTQLSDRATTLMAAATTSVDPTLGTGKTIELARRLRAEVIDVVTYTVLAERSAGATWTQIAAALSLDEPFVREHYEPIERQWMTGNGIAPIVPVRADQAPLRLVREQPPIAQA